MPTSKSKTKSKKDTPKLRPYRIDYFIWEEMQKDKALVRSAVIRAANAKDAKDALLTDLSIHCNGTIKVVEGMKCDPPMTEFERELTVIRAYRFYKKLSAEPKKKTYIEIAQLLPAKKALAVMERIESNATEIKDYYRQHLSTPKEQSPATVFIPEWGPDADTSNCCAGQPSPYIFPDIPTKDAVFGGEYSAESLKVLEGIAPARPESRTFVPCRWHGEKYIDQANGDRCTALDLVPRRRLPLPQQLKSLDLDAAAPIIHPPDPTIVGGIDAERRVDALHGKRNLVPVIVYNPPSVSVMQEYTDGPVQEIHPDGPVHKYELAADEAEETSEDEKPRGLTIGIFCGALAIIVTLVYVFFRYLAKQ